MTLTTTRSRNRRPPVRVLRTILYSERCGIGLYAVECTDSDTPEYFAVALPLRDGERVVLGEPRFIDWSTSLDKMRRLFNDRTEAPR